MDSYSISIYTCAFGCFTYYGSFVIPAHLREKYKDYKWKKDYALHVENIDRAYKGLPPIQPKKSVIVEFLKARKAKVCPVIEYKAE